MDTKDKRVKREIANSNERRRMQSINAGFQRLKRLLPVNDGEKMSKAAILQQASEFIQQIDRDKTTLFEQNTLLRGILIDIRKGTDAKTALRKFDLDTLPNVPLNSYTNSGKNTSNISTPTLSSNSNSSSDGNATHNNSRNNARNSNENSDNNGNNDCIRSSKTSNRNRNGGQENNKNNQSNCDMNAPSNHKSNYQQESKIQPPIMTGAGEIISDRVTNPNNVLVSTVAKAAIALPLEVPYTSETVIRVDQHHHLHTDTTPPTTRKMIKVESAVDPHDPASKGQSLDTICKAIMEIEGDRVFTTT